MFMDKVTTDRNALDEVMAASRLLDDPPDGLLAALSWEHGDGQATMVTLWESPGARGQVAMERMMPLFESGALDERHGEPHPVEPVHVYVRSP
ncbi:MAG TPA: hypothetical protein VJ978_16000 [Nitriliruptoraceae bacterium]|nr:hypothetical protein [Nitriliruptoraceae bacterium]